MRFIGSAEAKIDAKGRAFLPASFRRVLQASGEAGLVMSKDIFQPCAVGNLIRYAVKHSLMLDIVHQPVHKSHNIA